MFNVGDKFIGSVDGSIFEIIEFRNERKSIGLKPDYKISCSNGKSVYATNVLLTWLIKSGGLIRA